MRITILTFMALTLLSLPATAQDIQPSTDKNYSFTAVAAGGFSRDIGAFQLAGDNLTVNRDQFSAYTRVMWHPGNLLRGGLEVGYVNFFSVTAEGAGESSRNAIPIYMVFSMQAFQRVDFTVGYGLAILNSVAKGTTSETIVTSSISTSVYAAIAYTQPISDDLSIGAALRLSRFDHFDDATAAASIEVSYRFLDY